MRRCQCKRRDLSRAPHRIYPRTRVQKREHTIGVPALCGCMDWPVAYRVDSTDARARLEQHSHACGVACGGGDGEWPRALLVRLGHVSCRAQQMPDALAVPVRASDGQSARSVRIDHGMKRQHQLYALWIATGACRMQCGRAGGRALVDRCTRADEVVRASKLACSHEPAGGP